MAQIDFSKYSHSPIHLAVLHRDHQKLRSLLSSLPRLSDPSLIITESDSLTEESKAETISSQIDRRDVPSRETPLHLAVRLGDAASAEMLMSAGADWSLQNEQGWSALQEAICLREETLAKIIIKHYQPLAWAKWCRRLPRVVNTMRRMRDFYMEITFHFESSVIPFISRIAPSDTYKIWKRGSNLRADMTLAGFDGFKIQRSDQTILFLGEGSEDGKIKAGSLCMINHKDKEIMNALEGAGTPASESEIQQEVNAMSQTNIFRPGVDVTQAVLLPQMTWRNKEKQEMVGNWKCKLYDMNNVMVSVKSRRVPGAMTDEEFFNACNNNGSSSNNNSENNSESEEFDDILTEEEKRQLEQALKMDGELNEETGTSNGTGFAGPRHSYFEQREIPIEDPSENKQEKKGWFGNWGRTKQNNQGQTSGTKKNTVPVPARNSLHIEEKVSDLLGEDSPPSRRNGIVPARHSISTGTGIRKVNTGTKKEVVSKESEYKKGLRPVLWLSPNFPLRTEELLPLLDILANKVKAIRRLRDLLTTKLPAGTFPVKVAIPVVPTIRVLVTFTKFEELQPLEEFSTPPSSPLNPLDISSSSFSNQSTTESSSSSSWIGWIKRQGGVVDGTGSGLGFNRVEDLTDPFAVPSEYGWVTPEEKKKKVLESKNNNGKSNKKGGKSQTG